MIDRIVNDPLSMKTSCSGIYHMPDRYKFKQGERCADNSSCWKVCLDVQEGRYTAEIRYGGAGGASYKLCEIGKEIFDLAGTFEDDDHKTEQLVRDGGSMLYISAFDSKYRELCPWVKIISFDGK